MSEVITLLRKYYLLTILAVFLIVKYLFSSPPGKFEEYPGNKVVSVESEDAWNGMMQDSALKGKLILVDFYATWCPPCRRASPVYGKMSIDYDDVLFLKVDVDKVPSLMRDQNVRAMPTFQLLRDSKRIDHVVGFDEQKIRRMIERHRSSSSNDGKDGAELSKKAT